MMQGVALFVLSAVFSTGFASHFPNWYTNICDGCDCDVWQVCIPTQVKCTSFRLESSCYFESRHPCKNVHCPWGKVCVVDLPGRGICVASPGGPIGDPCDPNPCKNGGTCENGDRTDFTCKCAPGYEGRTCQTDIDDCKPNPCENWGFCRDGVNSFTCECRRGFDGDRCENNIDDCKPNPCKNGGTCRDGINKFFCTCDCGFIGKTCEKKIAPCQGRCKPEEMCKRMKVDKPFGRSISVTRCVCVPKEKHGTCPEPEFVQKTRLCYKDFDCPGLKKCCPIGYKKLKYCSTPGSCDPICPPATEVDKVSDKPCQADEDCEQHHKCCVNSDNDKYCIKAVYATHWS